MEWWQHMLLYAGIWLLGFFTGTQAGISVTVSRMGRVAPTPQKTATPAELQQMLQLMGHMPGGSK